MRNQFTLDGDGFGRNKNSSGPDYSIYQSNLKKDEETYQPDITKQKYARDSP